MLAHYRRTWVAALRGGCLTALAACGLWLPAVAPAATPGAVILNQATLSTASLPTVQASVSVRISTVTLLRYPHGSAAPPAALTTLNVQPVLCGGNTLSVPAFGPVSGPGDLPALPAAYGLEPATEFTVGEPVFLLVQDPSANLNPAGRDVLTLTVHASPTGDAEVLTLQETAPDSGEFAGFINTTRAAVASDCLLSVQDQGQIYVTYGAERTDDVRLVDPYGVAFDAATGALLDGASVTLVDDLTGLPAAVTGDAGEAYPSTVVTGSSFSTGARTYTLRPGEYRFPYVAAGRSYHFKVSRPNYAFPTSRSNVDFLAPAFAGLVIGTGSRGESFVAPSSLPLRLDLPIDPVTSGLLLVKNAVRSVVAIGDFVPYDVVASNRSGGILSAVQLTDTLPPGFRFRPGSLKQNGVAAPDPQVSADGRTLTHVIGDMAVNADVRVTYVAEATAATPLGDAVNVARAANAVVQSNEARASVRVNEDLMRARALLAGRVLETEGCDDASIAAARPVPGARLYLEDGRYVVTDPRGRWHFDDLRPGTHVLQLDEKGLPHGVEILACANHTRAAGSAYSRFVDLQGGSLWQEDFYVHRPESPHLLVEEAVHQASLRLSSEPVAGGLHYTLALGHPGVPLEAATLQVMMPADLQVVPGSLRLDDTVLPDPVVDTKGWQLALPVLPAADLTQVSWDVALAPGARPGQHSVLVQLAGQSAGVALDFDLQENRAEVQLPEKLGRVIVFRPRFATFSTELAAADKRWLDDISGELKGAGDIRLEIVGHTDDVRVVPRKGRSITDNYQLSQARAQSVADYLKLKLGLGDDRIVAIGKGPDEPIADNKTPKGRESNRRVELKVFAQSQTGAPRLEVVGGDSGEQRREWRDWQVVPAEDAPAAGAEAVEEVADVGTGLLSHVDGEVVADRVQALRLRVNNQLKTEILLDGKPIPEDRLGFTKSEGKTTLMSYIGVDLGEPGPHVIAIRGSDPFGIVRLNQRVTVVVASDITRIRTAQSPENVADGRTPLTVRVELVDASGRTVPAATDLRLVSSGGLRPFVSTDAERAVADSAGKIAVGTDGLMKFAPVTRSGLYTIEVAYNKAVERIPVYVHPEKREWILVGLAQGSLAARTIGGNMQSAAAAGASDDLWQDGRVAFFAKGQIQGKWLLTMAYDSSRERATAFGGAINPERFYTLYADAADPRPDAPSKKKLYLRIERDAFYALFGDYDTGMSEVELARYNRAFTGFKSEYHDQRFDVNVYATDTGRGFARDEMRGDGTSGLYRLSRRQVLQGSEKVRIETRDRIKSEVVLSSQTLARWADYNIDYDRGEIFFKQPVLSQDSSFNPVWIVVEYETEPAAGQALNAGGRAAVKLADGKAVVGVTAVTEQNGINTGELHGLDTSYRVTPADTVRLELADSAQQGTLPREGSARLLEWKHDSASIKARSYYREQDGGFGLGQQAQTEQGTRKLGVEARYQYQQNNAFTADLFNQEMIEAGTSRQVIDLRDETSHDRYGYGLGVRHVSESLPNEDRGADQLSLNGRLTLPGDAVKLHSSLETAFLRNSQSLDYPDRFLLGADWQASRLLKVSLEQEWTTSELRDTENTRLGLLVQPWKGAKATTQLNHETSEAGDRLRSGLGLGQTLTLTREWSADFGYDRADTLSNTAGARPLNPQVPATFGPAGADFWAANAGANYRYADIKGVARVERREATDEGRWNLVGGLYRELNPEVAVALGLTTNLSSRSNGDIASKTLLRGSFAWRPDDARWMLLDRLDLGLDRQRNVSGDVAGHRLVNNLNANHRWDDSQVSLQYGSKLVLDTIDTTRYTGYTDLIGVEWRHDITPRWDIGWRNSFLHSWTPGVVDYQYGIEVGTTPVKNAWLSLGYNFEGFTDADFSPGEYTAQGIYLKVRLKVDQHSLRQIWNDTRGVFGIGGDAPAPADAAAALPADTDLVAGAKGADARPAATATAPAVVPGDGDGLSALAARPSSAPVLPAAAVAPAAAAPAVLPASPATAATPPAAAVKAPSTVKLAPAARAAVPGHARPLPAAAPPAVARAAAAPAAADRGKAGGAQRLTPERKAVIVQMARAKKELAEMQAKQAKAKPQDAPKLRRGEQNRRRERLLENELKVQRLLKQKNDGKQ